MDRLSQLPDSVIQHILSLTDAESVVQTCILSKRWTNIWRHVHTLNLFSIPFKSLCDFRRFIAHALRHCETSSDVLAISMELGLSVYEGWNVVIDAPRLTTFKLENLEPLLLSINNSPLLDKVIVSVPHLIFKAEGKNGELFLLVTNMLWEFSNAMSLAVSSDIIKSLKVKGYKPTFALRTTDEVLRFKRSTSEVH
ncbi:hypothetical protein SLEP1_g10914 [Rubroshorea leprosula]|uniref:F-box domain-containing protein n=1 Tax=Rubroshorea leprosula TaxID=152421 RepID=A0AAV5II46_9ROSI|nr:hypothetical protein SLEP1_g10914 [Rubroshorea leprosula]